MSKLIWDQTGTRTFETGVDHGVLYKLNGSAYDNGVAWSGLTGVTESPSGAEQTALYADNIKYLNLTSAEEYGSTVTAYTYPDEFAECDGSAELLPGVIIGQQVRKKFGLSYRTRLGNDTSGDSYGYKLHLVYGCTASPSEKNYQTVNDSPEAIEFSWEVSTTPVTVTGYRPTAQVTIDSTKTSAAALAALEAVLYGTDGSVSYSAATVSLPVYTAVTPQSGDNPSTNGWYERSGEAGSYTYTLTVDTAVDSQKTYYAKTAGSNPVALGLYERSGEDPNYTYTLSVDTEAVSGKTYYERTEVGGVAPRLPLPDEVKSILLAAG